MIKGERVVLSPLLLADMPLLLRWINDREEVLWNAPYRPVAEAQHAEWFHEIGRKADTAIFGIRLAQSDELIGTCQLCAVHPVHRSAELRIRIGDQKNRGKGYGTEAVRLLLQFGFRDLNLERISLHVFATNERAIALYGKLGFVSEGVLRRAAYVGGSYVDVVMMAVLREDVAEP